MSNIKVPIRLLLMFIIVAFITGCNNSNKLDKLGKWDLVYISDSTGWGVAEKYAETIKRDTGKSVHVKDYAIGALPAIEVLEAIQADSGTVNLRERLQSLRSDVAEAEVVVLHVNELGEPSKGGVQGGIGDCIDYQSGDPPDSCTIDMYQPYTDNLKSIYKEIFSLRNGQPTIIRATDLWNPIISEHRKRNMETACTRCWEIRNAAVSNAADTFNIPFVSLYDEFNGRDHNEDPREKGYIGEDGMHASEKGRQVIADLLSEVGYDPVKN